MKNSIRLAFHSAATIIIPFVLIFLGASGCGDDPAPKYAIKLVTNSTLGNILTDTEGRTLYYFANDFNGTSACSGACLEAWPVFRHNDKLTIHSDLNKDDFATITRGDGTVQTTYKGWPLYYFATAGKKEDAGKTDGQAVGGIWFVVKTDYAVSYTNTQLIGLNGTHYKSDFTAGDELTKYFSDDHGRTIYLFTNDRNGTNTFTNATYSNNNVWPIFYADIEKTSLPGALVKSDFNVINVGTESRKQLTYKGWPLYYFGQDTQRGDNKGVSNTPWRIINTNSPVAPN